MSELSTTCTNNEPKCPNGPNCYYCGVDTPLGFSSKTKGLDGYTKQGICVWDPNLCYIPDSKKEERGVKLNSKNKYTNWMINSLTKAIQNESRLENPIEIEPIQVEMPNGDIRSVFFPKNGAKIFKKTSGIESGIASGSKIFEEPKIREEEIYPLRSTETEDVESFESEIETGIGEEESERSYRNISENPLIQNLENLKKKLEQRGYAGENLIQIMLELKTDLENKLKRVQEIKPLTSSLIKSLEPKIKELQTTTNDVLNLQNELHNANQKIKDLENQITTLQAEMISTPISFEKEEELIKLKENFRLLNENYSNLQENEEKIKKDLNRKINDLSNELNLIKKEKKDIEYKLEQVQQKFKDYIKNIEKKDTSELEKKYNDLLQERIEYDETIVRLENKLKETKRILKNTENKNKPLEEKVKELEDELKNFNLTNKDNLRLQNELKKQKNNIDEQQIIIENLEEDINFYIKKLEEINDEKVLLNAIKEELKKYGINFNKYEDIKNLKFIEDLRNENKKFTNQQREILELKNNLIQRELVLGEKGEEIKVILQNEREKLNNACLDVQRKLLQQLIMSQALILNNYKTNIIKGIYILIDEDREKLENELEEFINDQVNKMIEKLKNIALNIKNLKTEEEINEKAEMLFTMVKDLENIWKKKYHYITGNEWNI